MHPRKDDTTRPDQRARDTDPDLESDEDLALAEQKTFEEGDEANQVEAEPKKGREETEKELDHGLKETFPASDPVSINPGAD